MGRTQNSLVTSAQANRQIQNEQAPLNTQLNKENQDYSNANQDYQSALSQSQNAANANLGFQNQHQSYLQGIYNDLYTQENNASQAAEAKREFDTSQAAAANSRASSSAKSPYSVSRDKNGGFQFTGDNNAPITAAQYYQGVAGNDWQGALGNFILNSSSNDALKKDVMSNQQGKTSWQTLVQRYPYVFGGV